MLRKERKWNHIKYSKPQKVEKLRKKKIGTKTRATKQ